MDKDNRRKRKREVPEQEWNPHWTLKLLYGLWRAFLGALKVAAGAVVLSAVPDNATAAGVPAKIVRLGGRCVHNNDAPEGKEKEK